MTTTYIKTISMCGGHDKAFHVSIEQRARDIEHFYFCTDEGISTHRSAEHMYECLNDCGFDRLLDIKAQAVPTIDRLLAMAGLPDNDRIYLESKRRTYLKDQ